MVLVFILKLHIQIRIVNYDTQIWTTNRHHKNNIKQTLPPSPFPHLNITPPLVQFEAYLQRHHLDIYKHCDQLFIGTTSFHFFEGPDPDPYALFFGLALLLLTYVGPFKLESGICLLDTLASTADDFLANKQLWSCIALSIC